MTSWRSSPLSRTFRAIIESTRSLKASHTHAPTTSQTHYLASIFGLSFKPKEKANNAVLYTSDSCDKLHCTLIKMKTKFSSYKRKSRRERLLCHIWLTAASWTTKYLRIFSYIVLGSPSSYMTLQPLPSDFPYIWGNFSFLFYQCRHSWQSFFLQVSEARGRGQQEGEEAGSSDSSFRRYHFKFHTYLSLKFFSITVKCSLQVIIGSTIVLADFYLFYIF